MTSKDAAGPAAGRAAAEASRASGDSPEPQSPGTAGIQQGPDGRGRPRLLLIAAVALAAEAVALLVVTVLNVMDITSGQAYQESNALGLIALQVLMAAGLAWLAFDVTRLRPWTRTPAVMVQILILVVAVILLRAHQYEWGVPALVLSLAGLAGLLNPRSLRALARPASTWEKPDPAKNAPAKKVPPKKVPPKNVSAKPGNPKRSGNPARRNPAK